jgi:hypothetical protein
MVQGKQRGRPPLAPGKAKRASFNTRLRPSLKVVLEAAATQQGRSLSEEIEYRLERSLDDQRHLVEALELGFGRQVAGLMLAIGCVIRDAAPPPRPGELGWLSSPEAFRVIAESISLLLQAVGPDANPKAWASLRKARDEYANDAQAFASFVAEAIARPEMDNEYESAPLLPIIRSWLGEAAIARLSDRLALRSEADA